MTASPGSSPPIHTVAVCYRLPPDTFARRLQAIAARAGTRLCGVVVSNHPEHSLQRGDAGGFLVARGTNAHLDFSGYFEGFEHLPAAYPEGRLGNVLFLNDSLFTRHAAATILPRVIELDKLLQQLEVPAIGGKLEPYRAVCLRNPWSGHVGFVTTFCFMLNARALPALQSLPSLADTDGVLSDAPVGDAAWGAKLDPAMRETIRAHLLYFRSPILWQGTPPSPDEALIRKKAQCVYFEQRLSGIIGASGAVVPINSGPRSHAAILLGETLTRIARAVTK